MNKNEIFTLWIPNSGERKLPILAHLSLKSMVLCGHDVILYTYCHLENIPEGVEIRDANEILDIKRIFKYKTGHKTYSGFSNLFRLHRIYKYGGTWLDLDVILIRNINEKYDEDILICSEPTFRFYLHPNNALIRFPKKNPFIKYMLDYSEEVGENIVHGQTGPKLIASSLKKFPELNKYINHFNCIQLLGWKYLNDYSKNPKMLFNKINMDEIIGFHINNTFFEDLLTTKNPNGMFELLKKSILNSNSQEEYYGFLKEYCILNNESFDKIMEWDLKYLEFADENFTNNFKYTILIDSKNFRKVEIYNILHSIGFGSQPQDIFEDIQIMIFGKTDIGNDKIRFKENIMILASEFENIYPYIDEYIYGEYVIPLNNPIIFCPKFFKDKIIKNNIETYILENNIFVNIINKKNYKTLLYKYGVENIFNLSPDILGDLNKTIINKKLIFNYEYKSENVLKLIQLIDGLDNLDDDNVTLKFLNTKSDVVKLEFKNLINEVSYHYYTSYRNIISSSSFYEFKLKEHNTRLECLSGSYLNKLNTKYNF